MTLKRCANCANGVWTCREQSVPEVCIKCGYKSNGDPSEWKPINPTNADRIRAMSDEELKEFLCNNSKCEVCQFELWGGCNLRNWLSEPAEVEHE